MARRDGGLLAHLIHLPWHAGVAFGVIGFAVLRWGVPAFFAANAGRAGGAISVVDVVAGGLAWVALAIGLLGASLSIVRTRSRSSLLEQQRGLETLRALPWTKFEQLVGEAFRRQGYRVEETGQGGADGGIDLLLSKDGAATLVQCKQWRSRQVGVSVVREMFGLMHHHRAAAVKIVCTGVFSSDCYRFAVGKPLELIDGDALHRLVAGVQATPLRTSVEARERDAQASAATAPDCPRCSTPMVERRNRTTGARFWGCPQFPRCQGTVAV